MNEKLKFYCQKVLPLIYDESLSYYEVLCKLANVDKELCNDVIKINEKVNTNSEEIKNINAKIANNELISNKKCLFIGDSYGLGYSQSGTIYTPYSTFVKSFLNLELVNISESGAGFVNIGDNGHTFIDLLDLFKGENTEITDIFVVGGFNDKSYENAQILNAMNKFRNKCNNLFINAKIHVGFVAWCRYQQDIDILYRTFLAYQTCEEYNMAYMNGVEYAMHDMSFFDSDNIHPNESGQISIGKAISNYILTGSYTTNSPNYLCLISPKNNNVFSGGIYQQLNGNIVTWGWYDTFNVVMGNPTQEYVCNGENFIDIGTLDINSGCARGNIGMKVTVPCILTDNNGAIILCFATIRIVNGELEIAPIVVNNNLYATTTIKYITLHAHRSTCPSMNN